MAFESLLRTDILTKDLTKDQKKIRVFAETQYFRIVTNTQRLLEKTKTPEPAKNIIEVMSLVKDAIEDYDRRTHTNEDAKVKFLYEEPDKVAELEAITVKLTRREPGMYGQGRPFENNIRQLRPILREELEDKENPGYRRAVLGQWYDNVLTFTCWARTNKTANERALWFENVMEEYTWFFAISGVNRILYHGRTNEKTINISENKVYGRPIEYFVRTEKLRNLSQKELEEVCIRFAVATD